MSEIQNITALQQKQQPSGGFWFVTVPVVLMAVSNMFGRTKEVRWQQVR